MFHKEYTTPKKQTWNEKPHFQTTNNEKQFYSVHTSVLCWLKKNNEKKHTVMHCKQ